MAEPRALIVDDEEDICELIRLTLGRMDIASDSVTTMADAYKALEKGHYNICLTDMNLPDGNGLDLVSWIQDHKADLPVAVITAHGHVEAAVNALKNGAFDFVSKPVDLEVLRRLINTGLKVDRSMHQKQAVAVPANSLISGQSAVIEKVRDVAARVAKSQAPVFISGESGTGKERVARLIHALGPNPDNAFIAVNCGAIPSELMESEFFGHKKGSFTGADRDKLGLFRSASGGTLFLDEVADLPLHMQVKLLRVIQERAVRPVGDSHEQAIDVRVLSATHKPLQELVETGLFREDLFYRINVIEIQMPPLRERGDDLLLLAEELLEKQSEKLGIRKPKITEEAKQKLASHAFPGNVRELENVLERALTLCDPGGIKANDIVLRESLTQSIRRPSADLEEELEEVERTKIIKALEQTKYNKTQAAELLGISFRALRYRIKKLDID